MKLAFTSFVMMMTIACALEAKAPSSQVIDSGRTAIRWKHGKI